MAKTSKLFTTVTICWIDRRGTERDCDVEVGYTFDGEDMNVASSRAIGYDHDDIPDFDELVWQATNKRADEAYAEWQAEYGEYLRDQQIDREAA
jgi:hypothetical protein